MGNTGVEETEPLLNSEAWEAYVKFNQDNRAALNWYRQVENEFWKWHILALEAEAEVKYFTMKNNRLIRTLLIKRNN